MVERYCNFGAAGRRAASACDTVATMPDLSPLLVAILTAFGLGLLIGIVRERQHPDALAGVRTYGLTAVTGAIAASLGLPILVAVLVLVIGLVWISYWRSSITDTGVTGEVALVLTLLLGALALTRPMLAVGIGVVTAGLLYAKASLHRLSRELLSEREVHDGLLLLASALVILPIVPDRAIDPWSALNPATIWRLVVLVMAISALGHVALRVVGNRWGLALAGFLAGYVSSTAALAGFGQRAKDTPTLLRPAVGAAMLANLASLTLFVPILATTAPTLLQTLAPELAVAASTLLVGGALGLRAGASITAAAPTAESRMFRLSHALAFAGLVAVIAVFSAGMNLWFGSQGALIAATLAAAVELHAAVATLGQLFSNGTLDASQARLGLVGLLAASVIGKTLVAFASGGRAYGLRVAAGLVLMLLATVLVTWLAAPAQ